MGNPRPVSISAKVFRNFAHLVEVPVFDVEDEAHAFIRFANDAIVELETSWAANLTDDTPIGPEWVGRDRIIAFLFGTKRNASAKNTNLIRRRRRKTPDCAAGIPFIAKAVSKWQLRNFAAAIRGQAPAINNAEQAFELMEMIDGIYARASWGAKFQSPNRRKKFTRNTSVRDTCAEHSTKEFKL